MSIRDTFSSQKDIEPDQYQRNIVDFLDNFQKEIINEKREGEPSSHDCL